MYIQYKMYILLRVESIRPPIKTTAKQQKTKTNTRTKQRHIMRSLSLPRLCDNRMERKKKKEKQLAESQ